MIVNFFLEIHHFGGEIDIIIYILLREEVINPRGGKREWEGDFGGRGFDGLFFGGYFFGGFTDGAVFKNFGIVFDDI